MTRPRYDEHSTEFGLWLRLQEDISSVRGYLASNLDYIWANYKTGDWMLIEEKRHGAKPKLWQRELFVRLNNLCRADPHYKGMHLIVFEHTGPTDGCIWIDNKKSTINELIKFLQFGE